VHVTYTVSTDDKEVAPDEYNLLGVFPNPLNPSTTISYAIPEQTNLAVAIYDLLGRHVWTRKITSQAPGEHQLKWNGTNEHGQPVTSGVYIVQLSTESWAESRKVVVLR